MAGILGAMALERAWPTEPFEIQLAIAFLTGPVLFGFVATHGSVHIARGRPPTAGWWLLGTYAAVPLALTAGSFLLGLSPLDGGWSAVALGGIAVVAAVPYAIGSVPFLWPGRSPPAVTFILLGVGATIAAPAFVMVVQMALDAQAPTSLLLLGLAQLSLHAVLLGVVLLDGLTHRGGRQETSRVGSMEGATIRPGERWPFRLSRLLLAAAAVWIGISLVGTIHLWTATPGLAGPWLAWTVGYLLAMGLLALLLAASVAGASPERPQGASDAAR